MGQEYVIPKASFQAERRFERLARDGAKLGGNRRCDYCEFVEVWSLLLRRRRRPTEVRRGESGEVQGSATLLSAEICFSALLKVSANSSTLQSRFLGCCCTNHPDVARKKKKKNKGPKNSSLVSEAPFLSLMVFVC